jgi:hypothetical protein
MIIMKTASTRVLVLVAACLCTISLRAQTPQATPGNPSSPHNRLQLHLAAKPQTPGSRPRGFLASEEGRALMQVSGSPISKTLNARFGVPSQAALAQARARWAQMLAQPRRIGSDPALASAPCNKNGGARFNLEPRQNAVFQNGPSADFILNGIGTGDDLIVQTANDWRGAYISNTWDNSMSGYYVHSSTTADCSVQFEGGLPNFENTFGLGQSVVAADSGRGAFFMADDRFPGGFALFRASASDLLNPQICPPGTHQQQQADSCWMQTPPVLLDRGSEDYYGELEIAVDERQTGGGKGAGDVYVVASMDGDPTTLVIAACTNSLNCSPLATLATSSNNANQFPFIQVRPDGVITVSYAGDFNAGFTTLPILFVTCTPAGAPNPPVCQQPVTVTTVTLPGSSLANIDLIVGAPFYPKFANRLESSGKFTTFMVYNDCKNPYNAPPPNASGVCLNTEVSMTISQDGGQTWSTPSSITPGAAQHFFPTVSNDASTGTVSIAYYSTEGDVFFRNTRVLLSQIAPGSTTLGPARPVTAFSPIDTDPGEVSYGGALDYRIGAIARGTGTPGQTHLYVSFDSATVNGTYNKGPLPELNNHIELLPF